MEEGKKTHFQWLKESRPVFLTPHSQANLTVAWLDSWSVILTHTTGQLPKTCHSIQNIRPGPFRLCIPTLTLLLLPRKVPLDPQIHFRDLVQRATSLWLSPLTSRLTWYFSSPQYLSIFSVFLIGYLLLLLFSFCSISVSFKILQLYPP